MTEPVRSPAVAPPTSGRASHLLQAKLTIGASNDPLEQEADRVADQVMAAPAHPQLASHHCASSATQCKRPGRWEEPMPDGVALLDYCGTELLLRR